MIIKSNNGVTFSTSKDKLLMEDIFWLYNPLSHTGIAAFKFDSVIYLALKNKGDWSDDYELDSIKPLIIQEDKIESFIKSRIKEGMLVVFNTLTDEYNGIQNFSEKDVKENITLTFSTLSLRDLRVLKFEYRDVNDLIICKSASKQEDTIRKLLSMEDLTVPFKAQETLTVEQILHRYKKMTELFRETQATGKISIPVLSMNFQSIRHVLHFASRQGHIDLLKDMHLNYDLHTVEPVTDWLINGILTEANDEVIKYYLDNIPYSEMPWNSDNNIMQMHSEHIKKAVGEKITSPIAQKLYDRYYIENFIWS